MKNKILTIIGTRPEIIKMYPIINKLDKYFDNKLVWSGQHYDFNMVKKIFNDVNLRRPDYFIKLPKKKIPLFEIQREFYKIITKIKPKAIIYHGDTFTTLASALVSNFFFYKIIKIHIEGGYRSDDKNQIEERARLTIDHLSDHIFVTSEHQKKNLFRENIKKNIYVVGNSITDSVNDILKKKKRETLKYYNLENNKYIYVTIHRSENVDNKKKLIKIIQIINWLSLNYKIIFPIHPRTRKKIKQFRIKLRSNVILIQPINYSMSIYLTSKCFFCFSDSGGLQEEAIILKKRCLIPSNKTPHAHYLDKNANQLINMNNNNFVQQIKKFILSIKKNRLKKFIHKKKTSQSIASIISRII